MTRTGSIIIAFMCGFLCPCLPLAAAGAPDRPDGERREASSAGFDHYLLGPDDVLRVTVEQHPEWSGEFPVRPGGAVFIPGIGEAAVEGLSKDGAEIAITTLLERYINNPRVTTDIVQYASQVIYVFGEVFRPGRYPTEGKTLTLRDAVILAGLPTRFAATGRVFVITPSKKRAARTVVNLHRILYRGELERNVTLKPGDIVYVPQTVIGQIVDFLSAILRPVSETYPAATALIAPTP